MFDEVVRHHSISVQLRAVAITHAMCTIRVRHEVELPVVLYKLVDQALGSLIMDIVVPCSVNQ